MFCFIFSNTTLTCFVVNLPLLAVHLGDGHLLEVMDARDEEGLFFDAADHVLEVLVQEVGQDIFLEVLVKIARLLDVDGQFRDDNGHEAVTEELAVVILRDGGEVLRGRLGLLAVKGGNDLFELGVLGDLLFSEHRHGRRNWNRHGSNDRLLAEVHIARLDVLEGVEEEVDALGVVVANLAIDAVLADANAGPFVVVVDGCENGQVVVVDSGFRALLDVVLDIDAVYGPSHVAEGLLDPARVVADAGECLEQLLVGPLRLTLEVAEVEVAGPAEQRELTLVVRVENLEARRLGNLVAGGTERVSERAAVRLEASHDLLEAVEVGHERRRDVVGAEGRVDQPAVVEGPDVVDEGPLKHLEVELRVLEDELVGVAGDELVGERRRREATLLAVDAAEALVEELPDGLLADPVVVVGVQGSVGGEAPVVAVEVCADEGTTEVLVRGDAPFFVIGEDKWAGASLGQLVRLGVAEAEEHVVMLAEDGPDGFFDGGAELGRFVGVHRVVRGGDDHVGPLVLENAAALAGEVVAYSLEARSRERADVGGDVRHGRERFESVRRWICTLEV